MTPQPPMMRATRTPPSVESGSIGFDVILLAGSGALTGTVASPDGGLGAPNVLRNLSPGPVSWNDSLISLFFTVGSAVLAFTVIFAAMRFASPCGRGGVAHA